MGSLFHEASTMVINRFFALKKNVKQAQENDVFGLPTFICEDELFWGNDSIEDLNNFLLDQDILDKNKYRTFVENYGVSGNE